MTRFSKPTLNPATTLVAMALLAAVGLTACDRPAEERRDTTVPEAVADASATIISPPPLAPSATTTDEQSLIRKDDVMNASWRVPNVLGEYPAVLADLRQAAQARIDQAHAAASEDRQSALADSRPFRPHDYQEEWQTAGQTAKLEVLRGETYAYTGGAHGMTAIGTLLLDRTSRMRVNTVGDASDNGMWTALFDEPARVQDTLRVPFCKELERQWFAKRGAVDAAQQTGPFWQCPELTPQPFVLVVENGKITALNVILGQYVAGPYAEGIYEVRVPVTEEVLTHVKPAYRSEFTILR